MPITNSSELSCTVIISLPTWPTARYNGRQHSRGDRAMRSIVACCLLLAVALPCHAQGDKPKPNTLTPKEIADGWILLFDGETTFGMKTDGDVRVTDGLLIIGGDKKASIQHTIGFVDYELSFEHYQEGKGAFHPGWKAENRSSLQGFLFSPAWYRCVLQVRGS